MNEVIKTIMERRSVRAFLPEQIKDEELETVLQAGLYAPSAHNQQSWHFTVITDQAMLEAMSQDAKEFARTFDDKLIQQLANNEKFQAFYHAPTVIYISGEEKAMMPDFDCAAAAENMLLAAEAIGLGACCVGFANFVFGSDKGAVHQQKLQLPDGYKPYIAIALGYKKAPSGKAPARRAGTVNYVKAEGQNI